LERFRKPKKEYLPAKENGKIVLWQIKKVLHCHFSDLEAHLSSLTDPRTGIQYSIEELLMASIVLFLLNCDSRNDFNNKSRDQQFRQNYYRMFRLELPQMDAVNDLFEKLLVKEMETLRCHLIASLIEKRVFHKNRFFGNYFYIAIDATGVYNWGNSPIEDIRKNALKKEFGKNKNKTKEKEKEEEEEKENQSVTETEAVKVNYSNQVFEAVMIFDNGMSIPLMSEWIANDGEAYVKQDCELKAFKRLAVRLKDYFSRLNICFLADGLYSNVSMFDICRDYDWKFITVFKDGNLSSVWQEVNSLLPLKDGCYSKSQQLFQSNRWITRNYRWVKDIEYQKHNIHWIECVQETVHQTTGEKETNRFVFLTNLDVKYENIAQVLTAGRARWFIEDHFNTQKNREGALHHKFNRKNFNAIKIWHSVRQLSTAIKELVKHTLELWQLKKENEKMTWKQLWKDINAFLSMCSVEEVMNEFENWSKSRRQVRLE
jgi:hypothetical protein